MEQEMEKITGPHNFNAPLSLYTSFALSLDTVEDTGKKILIHGLLVFIFGSEKRNSMKSNGTRMKVKVYLNNKIHKKACLLHLQD